MLFMDGSFTIVAEAITTALLLQCKQGLAPLYNHCRCCCCCMLLPLLYAASCVRGSLGKRGCFVGCSWRKKKRGFVCARDRCQSGARIRCGSSIPRDDRLIAMS